MNGFDVLPYLAIPWQPHGRTMDGCDCWGLVRLVMVRERGILLPSFSDEYESPSDVRSVALSYRLHTNELARRVPFPEPFDAVLMRTATEPVHIGIMSSSTRMLHMRPEYGPGNVPVKSESWCVLGYYRWTVP